MAEDVGTGITIDFGTTGFTANIIDVTGGGGSRKVVEKTHHTSVSEETMPGDLVKYKDYTFTVAWTPGDTGKPPIDQPEETVTITYKVPSGLTNGATAVGPGFISDWEPAAPMEGRNTMTMTLSRSAAWAWTNAS